MQTMLSNTIRRPSAWRLAILALTLAAMAALALALPGSPAVHAQAMDDATLSALTVDGVSVAGFASTRTSYDFGVVPAIAQVTVAATTTNSNATVAYSPADADSAPGHQVDLSDGRNAVTVTVTAEDTTTMMEYTVDVNRGVNADFGWKAWDDFDTLRAVPFNTDASGLWSNGTTAWVGDTSAEKLHAYNLFTKARDASKDFDTLSAAGNAIVYGLWSDGTTMWVADTQDDKLYAYNLSTKARDDAKDFDTLAGAGNTSPGGLWSDETTMWVVDTFDDKLYAYKMSDKSHDADKDFDLHSNNDNPTGIWSDGTTVWVADATDDKLYAYKMSDKSRDAAKDFDTLVDAGNENPTGIWSDNSTMWVVDLIDNKIYSYNMPRSNVATLASLNVSPRNISGFSPGKHTYGIGVANSVTRATIRAVPANEFATVSIRPSDADTTADGHQVDLDEGQNEVTITVTAQNGVDEVVYTVNINRLDSSSGRSAITLDDLRVDDVTVENFHHLRREFQVVRLRPGELTVAWTTSRSGARVSVSPADSNPRQAGHQVRHTDDSGLIIRVTVGPRNGNQRSYIIRIPAPCHNGLGLGRVAFDSKTQECVILDNANIWVADGYTNQQAANALNNLRRWTTIGQGRVLPVVFGRYSPDNLTLAQLDAQLAMIARQPWAERASRDSLAYVSGRPENNAATGQPAITGTAQAGETLTADTSGIGDADGMESSTFAYQWLRVADGSDAGIDDATAATYMVADDDVGNGLKVRVSFTDDGGYDESVTSDAVQVTESTTVEETETATVEEASPPAKPTGLAATSVSHDSVTLGWDDPGDGTITGYVILRRDIESQDPGVFTTVEADTGSNGTAYTDSGVSPETRYTYRIKAVNSGGTSEQSGYVNVETDAAPASNTPASGAPAITGTAAVGETLSADTSGISDGDGMDGATFAYQWLRGDAGIGGATGAAYTVVADDGGTALKVRVSFTDDAGNAESLTSAAVAVPAEASAPEPPARPTGLSASGVAHDSVTLAWDDPGDSTITGYRVLRRDIVNDPAGTFSTVVDNTGSAATSYTDTTVSAETRYAYRVVAINASGESPRSGYVNVGTPEEPASNQQPVTQDPPGKPTGLQATAVSHDSVTLGWNDPGDDSITGYRILRRDIVNDPPGTFSTVAGNTGSAATSYTDQAVAAGTRYAYRIIALNASGDSPRSGYVNVTTADAP